MILSRALFVEMAIIVLIASIIGLTWNHRMLTQSWTGKIEQPPPAPAPAPQKLPLPLGIMQVKELSDRNEGYFIDARDSATYSAGHIKGARSLPLGEFEARIADFKEKVPRTMPLIIYCNGYGCHDSMDLGKKLIQEGYWEIYVFEGGYPEWKEANYPVEGTAP